MAASGNALIWPLYAAAVTGMVSPIMRQWVAGRLMLIAEVIGIKQAVLLANSLLGTKDIVDVQMEDTSPGYDAIFIDQALGVGRLNQVSSQERVKFVCP